MVDVDAQIDAVERVVGTTVLAAGEARVSRISQVYPTTPNDLWDACTTAERIARWFLPISGELRLGGDYQLEGNAGGRITACDPPRTFAATWEYGGDVSWITVTIAGEGTDRARFTLEHVAHVDDERWAEFGPGATGVGWDSGLLGLALYLAGGSMAPEAAATWVASDEGKRFMTGASEKWFEASVASGESPQTARAAADRTTAAYTAG